MIESTFTEASQQPPKSKYPGRKVYNKDAKRWMHMIQTYRNFGRTVGIYSDAFDIFIETLATRIYHDQQNVICIYGETGSGKSSLGLNICVALAKRLGCGFNLDEDYIYTTQDLYDKLDNPRANPISLFDEGSVTLASINAVRKSDRDIVTLFNTMRSRHWTTIICNPTFEKINRAVREDHCEFRIKCNSPNHPLVKGYSRGFFAVREISRMEFSEPYWPLRYTGVFGNYPEELREQYLAIKNKHQDELISTIRMVAQTENAKTRKQAEKYLAPEDFPELPQFSGGEDVITVNSATPEVVRTNKRADKDDYIPDQDTQPVKKTKPKTPASTKNKRIRGPTPKEIDKAIQKALNAQRKEIEKERNKEERKKDKEWLKIVEKQNAEIERLKKTRQEDMAKIKKTRKSEMEKIAKTINGNTWAQYQNKINGQKPVTATATDNADKEEKE